MWYFGMGRYIVLDSGFCFLKAILELKRNGVFGCALVKKRRYWPVNIPGDAMDKPFAMGDVQVGNCVTITRMIDGIWYNLWGMKEPDYMMKMMAFGSNLQLFDSCKETVHY